MSNYFFLYRLDESGDATIYGKFCSLSEAKLSASLLFIKEVCFILTGDMTKIYFYNEDGTWEYDVLTDKGRLDFLECYPNPNDYK